MVIFIGQVKSIVFNQLNLTQLNLNWNVNDAKVDSIVGLIQLRRSELSTYLTQIERNGGRGEAFSGAEVSYFRGFQIDLIWRHLRQLLFLFASALFSIDSAAVQDVERLSKNPVTTATAAAATTQKRKTKKNRTGNNCFEINEGGGKETAEISDRKQTLTKKKRRNEKKPATGNNNKTSGKEKQEAGSERRRGQ